MAAKPVNVRDLATDTLLADKERAATDEAPVAPDEAATTPDEAATTGLVSLGVFDCDLDLLRV